MTTVVMNPTTGRRVLVVDDIVVNRKLATAFFGRMGWHCADVEGGTAALTWLANNPAVDLLLLDISMPDLCGEDVCLQLRANPAYARLPIVAYTAHAMQTDIDRFMANGFNAALIKPISMQTLKNVVARFFPDGKTE